MLEDGLDIEEELLNDLHLLLQSQRLLKHARTLFGDRAILQLLWLVLLLQPVNILSRAVMLGDLLESVVKVSQLVLKVVLTLFQLVFEDVKLLLQPGRKTGLLIRQLVFEGGLNIVNFRVNEGCLFLLSFSELVNLALEFLVRALDFLVAFLDAVEKSELAIKLLRDRFLEGGVGGLHLVLSFVLLSLKFDDGIFLKIERCHDLLNGSLLLPYEGLEILKLVELLLYALI